MDKQKAHFEVTCKQGNHYNDCKLLVGGTPPNPENMKQSFMAVVDS